MPRQSAESSAGDGGEAGLVKDRPGRAGGRAQRADEVGIKGGCDVQRSILDPDEPDIALSGGGHEDRAGTIGSRSVGDDAPGADPRARSDPDARRGVMREAVRAEAGGIEHDAGRDLLRTAAMNEADDARSLAHLADLGLRFSHDRDARPGCGIGERGVEAGARQGGSLGQGETHDAAVGAELK